MDKPPPLPRCPWCRTRRDRLDLIVALGHAARSLMDTATPDDLCPLDLDLFVPIVNLASALCRREIAALRGGDAEIVELARLMKNYYDSAMKVGH
jgi:hypothetical protein